MDFAQNTELLVDEDTLERFEETIKKAIIASPTNFSIYPPYADVISDIS
jgi:hypothetical protein